MSLKLVVYYNSQQRVLSKMPLEHSQFGGFFFALQLKLPVKYNSQQSYKETIEDKDEFKLL